MQKEEAKENIVVKIAVVGAAGVGKTHLLHKFSGDASDVEETIGVDLTLHKLTVGKTPVTLEISDVSGAQIFSPFITNQFKDQAIVVFVFNGPSKESFDAAKALIERFEATCPNAKTLRLLVCNRADNISDSVQRAAKELALQHECRLVEIRVNDKTSFEDNLIQTVERVLKQVLSKAIELNAGCGVSQVTCQEHSQKIHDLEAIIQNASNIDVLLSNLSGEDIIGTEVLLDDQLTGMDDDPEIQL